MVPDLIDWAMVKLVNAQLAYTDGVNDVHERIELRLQERRRPRSTGACR